MAKRNEIPVCPLISIGSGIDMVCSQQNVHGMCQVFKMFNVFVSL